MIYSWDKKSMNGTFMTCVNALNKAKGRDVEFVEAKTYPKTLEAVIKAESNGTDHYYMPFWWEDLAKAVGKAGQDVDFEKLTDKQYLRLCKYIVKEIWSVARTISI